MERKQTLRFSFTLRGLELHVEGDEIKGLLRPRLNFSQNVRAPSNLSLY
jgi:hypothetical protein